MTKRGVLLSIIFSLALTLMLPFSISANGELPSPFVGFNCNFIDYESDTEYETDISGSGGTYTGSVAKHSASVNLTGDFTGIQRTSSGVTYITTETSVGSVSGNNTQTGTVTENAASESGTLNLNITSSSTVHTSESALMEVEIILDDNYIGYFNVSVYWPSSSSSAWSTKTIYVNGNSATFTSGFFGSVSGTELSSRVAINSFDLTKNTKYQWMYPMESYTALIYPLENLDITGLTSFSSWIYPVFLTDSSKYIFRRTRSPGSLILIWAIYESTAINPTNITDYYSFNDSYTCDEVVSINTASGFRILKATFTNTSSGNANINLTRLTSGIKFIPIYIEFLSDKYNVSTDFALYYGLNNELLSNLNIIANGTAGSNQAASNVTNESSNLTEVSDDIHDMESNFNSDLNTNLQAIDTTITPGTFGSSFLSSASWVKTQFDQLTSNTPFGSVLSFSLVLGLGLLIVGRALK